MKCKKRLTISTKGVIRIRKSKKNRQHNGQKKKYKRTNNDLQNIHRKPYSLDKGYDPLYSSSSLASLEGIS